MLPAMAIEQHFRRGATYALIAYTEFCVLRSRLSRQAGMRPAQLGTATMLDCPSVAPLEASARTAS